MLTVMSEDSAADVAVVATDEIVIELDSRTTTAGYRKGDTLLQTARSAGLQAPYSCETGSCGTCMARITEGNARMVNNDALEDDVDRLAVMQLGRSGSPDQRDGEADL